MRPGAVRLAWADFQRPVVQFVQLALGPVLTPVLEPALEPVATHFCFRRAEWAAVGFQIQRSMPNWLFGLWVASGAKVAVLPPLHFRVPRQPAP